MFLDGALSCTIGQAVQPGIVVITDCSKGHLPAVLAEMGIRSEWEDKRAGMLRKAALADAVTGLARYLLQRRSHR